MVIELREAYKKFISAKMWDKAYIVVKEIWESEKNYKIVEDFRQRAYPYASETMELLKASYDLTAWEVFDDFCIATEWNRPPEQRFYLPRRNQLKIMVDGLQKLADDELDVLCISCPPGIGKTGLATFYMSWLAGRNPLEGMLASSHNASFLEELYNECLRMLDSEGEYRWGEIFHRSVVQKNAKNLKIGVEKSQKFPTFQFGSAGSGLAGKVRAVQLLYCDDLIENIEEATSEERLNKKYQIYATDLRQRKQGDKCKELHIATRWSVRDVIGRIKQAHEGNPRYMFISVPALNEKGESNFDYGGSIGFTTEFYEDIRDGMDEASWRALYMNEPIERLGRLYENLNRYFDLPLGEPERKIGVCDTSDGKGDFTVLPVFYVYGKEHYLVDCVCSKGAVKLTEELCADILVKYEVDSCQFESNRNGSMFADRVEEKVKAKNGMCRITKKWNQSNKESRIISTSGWILDNVLFLDDSKIQRGSAYREFVNQMLSYSTEIRNRHDDVCDALSQYAMMNTSQTKAKATLGKRFF